MDERASGIGGSERIVDARPTLAAGGEPFGDHGGSCAGRGGRIAGRLRVEPVPLEGVLGEQGFGYIAEELENGDSPRVEFRHG